MWANVLLKHKHLFESVIKFLIKIYSIKCLQGPKAFPHFKVSTMYILFWSWFEACPDMGTCCLLILLLGLELGLKLDSHACSQKHMEKDVSMDLALLKIEALFAGHLHEIKVFCVGCLPEIFNCLGCFFVRLGIGYKKKFARWIFSVSIIWVSKFSTQHLLLEFGKRDAFVTAKTLPLHKNRECVSVKYPYQRTSMSIHSHRKFHAQGITTAQRLVWRWKVFLWTEAGNNYDDVLMTA